MRFFKFFFLAFLVISCSRKAQIERVSFYFSAHPDDWQLFMGEEVWKDIQDPLNRTVFFLTTAGDAAMGVNTGDGASQPYYLARERGYINSITWAFDAQIEAGPTGKSTLPLSQYAFRETQVNGKRIKTYSLPGISVYLLYLPDGFPQGQHTWSLEKLEKGEISEMPTIDSSAVYKDWEDLRKTITMLMKSEIYPSYEVEMNLAERDTSLNPGDHSDHWYTSLLGEKAIGDLADRVKYYQGYSLTDKAPNLNAEDEKVKKFVFSANAISKEEAGYASPWDDHHLSLTQRSYWREVIISQ